MARTFGLAVVVGVALALPAQAAADVGLYPTTKHVPAGGAPALGGHGQTSAHPCRAALPHAQAVPAPIVLWNSCGAFELSTSGRLRRLPRHWLALHGGGTGRRFGAHLQLRRDRVGRIVLLERGREVWRSSGVYRNDGGAVAFGPHEFAFASYRRGVFMTDLSGPERLVARGRGLFPYSFTDAGQLLVAGGHDVALVGRDGSTIRRFRFRARNGFAFDESTSTFYFVTRSGILAAARSTRLRLLGKVRQLDGMLRVARPGLLIFEGGHSFTVTRRDGTFVAGSTWHGSRIGSDSGVSVSEDGHAFAYRLTDARPGKKRASAAVYLLHSGATAAHVIYRHRLGASGCAVGANLSWHGKNLLYSSSDGARVLIDTRTGRTRDLSSLARSLPRLARTERASAAWRSDFPR